MQQKNSASKADRLVAGSIAKQQKPAPPSPKPPVVDKSAWEKSVEQKKLKDLTVHDLGLIVFNETHSYSDRTESNEPIGLAHVVINGDLKYGPNRQKHASTALPKEPEQQVLNNRSSREAYDSSMKAAREAYLSGHDPTNGALYSIQRDTPDRSNYHFKNGKAQGVRLRTQSGPYENAFPNSQVPSRRVWINTYSEE